MDTVDLNAHRELSSRYVLVRYLVEMEMGGDAAEILTWAANNLERGCRLDEFEFPTKRFDAILDAADAALPADEIMDVARYPYITDALLILETALDNAPYTIDWDRTRNNATWSHMPEP